MNITLHGSSTLSVLLHCEKKAKDLAVGDKILCFLEGRDILLPITGIATQDYNNWVKVLCSDDQERIFDRTLPFSLEETFSSLLEDDIIVNTTKDYNKMSKGYSITLEGSFDGIYVNDILIKVE